MSQIIFLHGPSSSGKTTLAQAIRSASPKPFLHLSIDHFRDSGAWQPVSYQNWSEARPAFFAGFHGAIAAFANAGNDLIIEHILDTPGWHETLQRLLTGHQLLFVGIMTPRNLLQKREAERKNRVIGSAARDHATVHKGLTYDLTLTGETSPDIAAKQVLEQLTQRTAISGKHNSNFF